MSIIIFSENHFMTSKIQFSSDQKNLIKEKYVIGKKTISDIARDYNLSASPIKSVLKEMGVKSRRPTETSRKYYLDHHYFDHINSFHKAYFLGLLMADGYNNENRGHVTLILKRDDGLILDIFSEYLKTPKPVAIVINKNGSTTCRMEICSKNISEKLSKLGCVQSKTFKLNFPEYLDAILLRHFVRGYFDGDGCISYNFSKRNNIFGNSLNSVVTFTSTEDFCFGISHLIKKELNVNGSMLCRHPDRHHNIRTLQISGNKQVEKTMEWMYNKTDLYFKRKYDKFCDFKNLLRERRIIVSNQRSINGKKQIEKHNRERIL